MSEKKFSCTVYDASNNIVAYVSTPLVAATLILEWGVKGCAVKSHGRTLWAHGEAVEKQSGGERQYVASVIEKRWREEPIRKSKKDDVS